MDQEALAGLMKWIRAETRLAEKAVKRGDLARAVHHARGAAVRLDEVSGCIEQAEINQAARAAEKEVA